MGPSIFKVTLISASLLVSALSQPGKSGPDLVLKGTVSRADFRTYRELPFHVPKGISRVTIDFSYTGKEDRTVIDLGLWDGERFRGWSGGGKLHFTVAEADATPSYLVGPIRPGTWKLILGIPNIREGIRSGFEARIFLQRGSGPAILSTFSAAPLRSGAAWYRGDLHLHTGHSDGTCKSLQGTTVPCPVFKTLEAAAANGLDFIAITDHNTTSQFQALRELQPYFDSVLLIPGREITTFEGHANVFGAAAFLDFRAVTVGTVLKQAQDLHAIVSINHPSLPSGESCMGCGWNAAAFPPVQAVEVVNGGDNGRGIAFWERQLNSGFHPTGIGGSDNHNPGIQGSSSAIGHPATVVWSRDLSETGILDGIRAGHVFVDLEGTRDRILDLTASVNNVCASMGDHLTAPPGASIQFTVHVAHAPGARLELIQDGRPLNGFGDALLTQEDEVRKFSLPADGHSHWVRANVRSPQGQLLLVGNPIYF